MTTVLRLPFPPSANSLFAGKRRRYISKQYKSWRTAAGWELRAQKARPIAGPVTLEIALTPPDKRRRDADNANKPILDLLVANGLLLDDSREIVRKITTLWTEVGLPGAVVTIRAA